jgi:hypothetical protein
MGNRVSIKTHVAKEIDRLNELVNSSSPGEPPRKVLTLDQLPKMQQMREQEIDLHHIGILFVLDKVRGAVRLAIFSSSSLFAGPEGLL